MQIHALYYDAFATIPGKGNPAGIVLDASGLSDVAMQSVAAEIGFNETAFVLAFEHDAVHIRFFTPGHEINLCGHATIATFVALAERNLLPVPCRPANLVLETKAGRLPIVVRDDESSRICVHMTQVPAQFVPYTGDRADVAAALGLEPEDLAPDLPLVYGSTGLWTLIVPVTGLAVMRRMRAQNTLFPAVLSQMPRVSIHPFCLETYDPVAQMHGRHFSSPFSGTVEDPVTGTASGVMGAYYVHYIQGASGATTLVVEQGQEIGRDGRVVVEVTPQENSYAVCIGGTAVFVGEMAVELL